VIHKFKCNGQDWAVILGELEFQEWRPWGYVPDDQPEATYYNRKVALSSSHAPSTSISGQEKRAAQQSINPFYPQHESNSATGNDNDEGEHMEDEDSDDQSVRITHGKRRRSRRSKSPDRIPGHRSDSQNTHQRSRTPAPQRLAQRSTRGSNLRMDNRTHNTTSELPHSVSSPLSMNASKRAGVNSNAPISNPNDLPHSDRHTPSSKDTSLAGFSNFTNTSQDPRGQTRPDKDDTNIQHTDQSASASDFQARFDEILLHVLSQLDIDSDSKLQKALQVLERAAKKSNDWQFNATRDVISRELANSGLQPLP
jgi:hypothetical protein